MSLKGEYRNQLNKSFTQSETQNTLKKNVTQKEHTNTKTD